MHRTLEIATVVLFLSCSNEPPELHLEIYPKQTGLNQGLGIPDRLPTSIVAVLADPSRYDGIHVALQGVLNLEFEGDQLCLDRDSLVYVVPKNCLWLAIPDGPLRRDYAEISKCNGHYAIVAGTVSSSSKGHLEIFQASLVDITEIAVIRNPVRSFSRP